MGNVYPSLYQITNIILSPFTDGVILHGKRPIVPLTASTMWIDSGCRTNIIASQLANAYNQKHARSIGKMWRKGESAHGHMGANKQQWIQWIIIKTK